MLIDTHAHIQLPEYDSDRAEVISKAKAAGVEKIIVIGIDEQTSQDAVKLAEENTNIYATVGLHPHNAKLLNDEMLALFEKLAKRSNLKAEGERRRAEKTDDQPSTQASALRPSPSAFNKVVAIGEIGLDYYRNLSPKADQKRAFESQIELAKSLNLPIVVHNRDSHEAIVQTLKSHSPGLQGVMHCFSGSLEMAKECIKLGFYISIAGPVTFPNASKLQEIAKSLPLEMLLVETDCPWLAPQSNRGKRNEPTYAKDVAEKIAQLRGVSFEEIAKVTTENAKQLFRF